MRRFNPVLASDTLVCLNCGNAVQVSQEQITRQVVITYDGCATRYVYCSNKCVNEGYEFSSTDAEETSHYTAHWTAYYEDMQRMEGAEMAAYMEDKERSSMPAETPETDANETDPTDKELYSVDLDEMSRLELTASDAWVQGMFDSIMAEDYS